VRGIGEIPKSGWALNDNYRFFDAEERFGVAHVTAEESTECISGQILLGIKKPAQCPAFGTRCNPNTPRRAMVSTEGACSAYYRYRRAETVLQPKLYYLPPNANSISLTNEVDREG